MSKLATLLLKSPNHTLEGAGLHDASLLSVTVDWKTAEAQLPLLLLGNLPATLSFHNVTAANLERAQPWGPSNSINTVQQLAVGEYSVEMQSGDKLHFRAAAWSLSISASPSEA